MALQVRTVTAPDRRELERLVQLAIAHGWQRIGTPGQETYNGRADKIRWMQAMGRK